MQDLQIAAIMGLVEGLTEFLPVSSTGHLIVAGNLLGFSGDKASCFSVFIQLGAILAVVMLYWRRFIALIPLKTAAAGQGDAFAGRRGLALLAVTTLPALVAGFFAHRAIKTYLFGPATVAWALGVGGSAIILAERFKPESRISSVGDMGFREALVVGLFQCLSLWPGVSRSAATIVGGLLSGLDRRTAAEYSFLAAVPVMIAATTYDLYKSLPFLQGSDFALFSVGFVVSFASAAAAIKMFISLVQRWSLTPYACYRIAIAPLIYFLM